MPWKRRHRMIPEAPRLWSVTGHQMKATEHPLEMLKYLFYNAENNEDLIRISGTFVPMELLVLQILETQPTHGFSTCSCSPAGTYCLLQVSTL